MQYTYISTWSTSYLGGQFHYDLISTFEPKLQRIGGGAEACLEGRAASILFSECHKAKEQSGDTISVYLGKGLAANSQACG